MSKSLKDQNRTALVTVLTANLLVFFVLITTGVIAIPALAADVKTWQPLLPASVAIIVCGVLNEQLSPIAKARIVFWRWRHPLPGSEAFTRYGPRDHRVDMAALEKKLGTLPTDPAEQNTVWYRLYRSVADEVQVADAHRIFLFNRDYASLAMMLLGALAPIAYWQLKSHQAAILYTLLLFAQYIIVCRAATNAGRRLVTNVLSISADTPRSHSFH